MAPTNNIAKTANAYLGGKQLSLGQSPATKKILTTGKKPVLPTATSTPNKRSYSRVNGAALKGQPAEMQRRLIAAAKSGYKNLTNVKK